VTRSIDAPSVSNTNKDAAMCVELEPFEPLVGYGCCRVHSTAPFALTRGTISFDRFSGERELAFEHSCFEARVLPPRRAVVRFRGAKAKSSTNPCGNAAIRQCTASKIGV
jgi:hypothetical protein